MKLRKEKIIPDTLSGRILMAVNLALAAAFAILAIVFRQDLFQGHMRAQIPVWLLWLVCLFLIFWRPELPDRLSRPSAIVFALLSPLYIVLCTEFIITSSSETDGFLRKMFGPVVNSPKLLWVNCLLVGMIVLLMCGITNSLAYGPAVAAVICVGFSFCNYYIDKFRGSAITAFDFSTIGTALEVAGGYHVRLTHRIFISFLLVFLLALLGEKLRNASIVKGWRRHLICAGTGILVFCLFFKGFILDGYIKDHYISQVSYFNTMRSYRNRGTAAVLARSVIDMFPAVPDNYSPGLAASIAAAYPSDPVTPDGLLPCTESPNIVVIINETFSDLHVLGDFDTTEDEMPWMRSLRENCQRGITYASVLGGRTANTEFEFLTGNTMGLLPSSSVPFQVYIREPLPSMASNLDSAGYSGIYAMHPYTPQNYNRLNAYPLLGFSEFFHIDNMPLPLETIRHFPSDESDYKNLIYLYEKTRSESSAPVFLYNMTVQNHSPYDESYHDFPFVVETKGLKRSYVDVNAYLSLIRTSDEAARGIMEYFSSVEEPVILLFMGDHQPSLSKRFYREVIDKKSLDADEESLIYYQVPYWIWTNFDMEKNTNDTSDESRDNASDRSTDAGSEEKAGSDDEKEDTPDIGMQEENVTSMNYLQARMLKACGMPLTGYQKFLLDLKEDIPIINAFGYYGKDGVFYTVDDRSSPWYDRIQEYAVLEYNEMFDTENRLEGFFEYAGY